MSTVCSRTLLSVNEEIPTSNLPDVSPGMIVEKLVFTKLKSSPRTAPMDLPKSTLIPMMVLLSVAKNSSGA